MAPFSFSSQQLVSLTELRSYYSILCDFLATFPEEVVDDSRRRENASQRFSKFTFRNIRNYTLDITDEVKRRLYIYESSSPEGVDNDEYLILSKAKLARLKLTNLSDDTFRLVVVDIHAEITRRYFGVDAPFELHLCRKLNAKTADLYFAAGKQACQVFEKMFVDETRYRQLLAYRGDKAQTILDLMSMLVDHPSLQPESKSSMIKAIMRLSQDTFLYPHSLLVEGIKRDGIPYSSGSFGDVYRGTFRGQAVALKVMKLYKRSDHSKVLKVKKPREAMLWAHLSHPNLLPFYGVFRMGDIYGRLALVSPWMARGNLRSYLRDELDVDRILLLTDIVEGLQYLHDNQIVHGDLKGDNIVITPGGRACLADFGLSNVVLKRLEGWPLASTLLQDGGTIGWMAPELLQQDNAVPTKESDIYALSMVFYEVFVGKAPYHETPNSAAVILRTISGKRPTAPDRDSVTYTTFGLSAEIWGLMERGWNSNPEARPLLKEFLLVFSGCERVDQRSREEFGEALPASKFRDAMNGVYRRMSIEEIAHVISWFA